ncbi:hypothetical protein [Paucisalibacillus sp. EB02]|uniref:hypothetical protein n=1 Tax=Paucisalibacillus sp. EB02 TaxID=1347087 RepID=UPI0004AD994D|nr:hypothetical protein [Paucisalibacillus sp. EB02]
MRKKPNKANEKKNKIRERIIFRFLIIAVITVLVGSIFLAYNFFVGDLFTAFVLNFIGTSFLYTAALILCSFFLYLCFVITIFNPQRVKKSSVITFTFVGIITLIITIFLVKFSVSETTKGISDLADYSNGEWQVKELLVTDVYRGGYHTGPGALIDTEEGEMSLHWESFLIYAGEKYRFTYLDATNTIIKVERLTD